MRNCWCLLEVGERGLETLDAPPGEPPRMTMAHAKIFKAFLKARCADVPQRRSLNPPGLIRKQGQEILDEPPVITAKHTNSLKTFVKQYCSRGVCSGCCDSVVRL